VKRFLLLICCFTFFASQAGCAKAKKAVVFDAAGFPRPQAKTYSAAYSGPKAKITVADLDIKTAKATTEAGLGLRQMMVGALKASDRFLIVEPQALNMGESGGEQPDTKAADLIIALSVAGFDPQASGGSSGVGGGGGVGSGAMGGLLNSGLNKAYIALDIHLIDAATSQDIVSTRVQGQASNVAESFAVPLWEKGALATGLEEYINTPMEKAIRICIQEAMRYIMENIKQEYYRY